MAFIAILLSLIFFLPYCATTYSPRLDLSDNYQFFHYVYSSLYHHDQIPFWEVTTAQGLASFIFLFFALNPFGTISLIFGYLLHLESIKVLYLVALFLGESVYILGVFVLVRHLLPGSALTALFAGTAAGLGVFFQASHLDSLGIINYVPIIMFLLIRFTETGNAKYLLSSAFVYCLSIIGCVIYQVLLHGYFYFLWLGLCVLINRKKVFSREYLQEFKTTFLKTKNIILLVVFLVICSLILSIAYKSFLGSIVIDRMGRGSGGGVHLDHFLYAGKTGLNKYLEWFSGGLTRGDGASPIFMGFTPAVLAVFSFFYCRGMKYYSVIAGFFVFIVLFTASDVIPIAYLFYFLPGMDKYRYLETSAPFAKLLFLFLAAYGFHYVTFLKRNHKLARTLICFIGGMVFLYTLDYFLNVSGFLRSRAPSLGGVRVSVLFVFWWSITSIILFFLARKSSHLKKLPVFLLLALIVEMVAFRGIMFSHYSIKDPLWNQYHTPKPISFQSMRNPLPDYELLEFPKFERELWTNTGKMAIFLGEDPCVMNSSQTMPSILDMIYARKNGKWREGHFSLKEGYKFVSRGPVLLEASGCLRPKVYLTADVEIVGTREEAASALKISSDLYAKPIILAPEFKEKNKQCAQVESPVNVIGFSPNQIEMKVNNDSKCEAWLIYLDAYAPDWKATIDGNDTAIYRANIGFKAIRVSPGVHNVQMKYLPLQVMWSFWLLIPIEVIGIFVMSGLLIRKAVEPLKGDGLRKEVVPMDT